MATEKQRVMKMLIQHPKFMGMGDVAIFLEEFERSSVSNNWDEKQKLEMIPNFLTETAKSWYRVYTAGLKTSGSAASNWKEFKEVLCEAFQIVASKTKYRIQLRKRRQAPDEVEGYYYEILDLCDQAGILDQESRISELKTGMNKKFLNKIAPSEATSTENILNKMRHIEENQFCGTANHEDHDYVFGVTTSKERGAWGNSGNDSESVTELAKATITTTGNGNGRQDIRKEGLPRRGVSLLSEEGTLQS